MARNPKIDTSHRDGLDHLPTRAPDATGPGSPRPVEIMVYTVGLILAMIIAWYQDPNAFF